MCTDQVPLLPKPGLNTAVSMVTEEAGTSKKTLSLLLSILLSLCHLVLPVTRTLCCYHSNTCGYTWYFTTLHLSGDGPIS